MATARTGPRVEHSSRGHMKGLDGVLSTLQKDLTAFAEAVQAAENLSVRATADIRIVLCDDPPKEVSHKFTIHVTLDDSATPSPAPLPSILAHQSTPLANNASSTPAKAMNGQQLASTQSPSRPGSQRTTEDVNQSAVRPFKRPKLDTPDPSSHPTHSEPPEGQPPTQQAAELHQFMQNWHTEWTAQGGWLFDNISKLNATLATANKPAAPPKPELAPEADILQKLDAVQNVLGQSINSASASTMAELSHLTTNLIPWLETCRKTSADKVQAREEKWRTSSANFHDQARRDREAAEQRIERRLEEQEELLVRIARASGVDIEDAEGREEEDKHGASRGESLGARLTAQLHMEASKAKASSRYDSNTGSITTQD